MERYDVTEVRSISDSDGDDEASRPARKPAADKLKIHRHSVVVARQRRREEIVVPVELLLNFKSLNNLGSGEPGFVVTIIQRRFHSDIEIPPFGFRVQGKTQKWEADRQGRIEDEDGRTVGNYSIARVSVPCDVHPIYLFWPFELCELELDIEFNSITGYDSFNDKETTLRPSIVMWRPYLDQNIKYKGIKDRCTALDLCFTETDPPLIDLMRSRKHDTYVGVKATFLAVKNWQDRIITVYSPLVFSVVAGILNYAEVRYSGRVLEDMDRSPFREQVLIDTSVLTTKYNGEGTGNFDDYFGNQIEISLIAVVIIAQIKLQTNSNRLTISDSFCAILMLGLMLSLFKRWEVCCTGLIVLTCALFIPVFNFIGFRRAEQSWRHRVHSSKVSAGDGCHTSKDASRWVKSDGIHDITKPRGKQTKTPGGGKKGGQKHERLMKTASAVGRMAMTGSSHQPIYSRSQGPLFVPKGAMHLTTEREVEYTPSNSATITPIP
jgi:hypothetical protein